MSRVPLKRRFGKRASPRFNPETDTLAAHWKAFAERMVKDPTPERLAEMEGVFFAGACALLFLLEGITATGPLGPAARPSPERVTALLNEMEAYAVKEMARHASNQEAAT